MLRDLTKNELAGVAGGISTVPNDVFPIFPPNSYLVGWREQIVSYNVDVVEWTEQPGIFTKIIHQDSKIIPVIEITPLWAPIIW